MICVVATADEDQEFVDFLNSVFEELNKDKPEKICISWLTDEDDSGVMFYNKCRYMDLRKLADIIDDEATLRMIAANQDRIADYSDEFDGDDAE